MTHPPANLAEEVARWSITFVNDDMFNELEWCAIDKFERRAMLLARPPATFRYAAHLITPTCNDSLQVAEQEETIAECFGYACAEDYAELIVAAVNTCPALLARIAALEEALEPFAWIVPSSLYPVDGSEREEYCVVLAPKAGNPVEFTGSDLARARAALSLNRSKNDAG